MADLFTPKSPPWVDGEQATAANFANRIENGLEALDQAVDVHDARLDAVESAVGGASANILPAVTTAQRGSPSVGRMVFDTTIGKPIIGNGTSWLEFGEGGQVGGPGSSTAPTGMTAVTQPDNSIVLNWNAVSGATHYKLYEVRSPTGVAGADNLLVTTSTRTPSSNGNYEYWVTAFVGGVESAESNHAIATLPYGGGSGGTSGSPAQLLAIGAGGGDWNLGIGYPSGHKDISPEQLKAGFSEAPYFYKNAAGTHVHFQVPMNGGRTSTNTKYPRSELREYRNGVKAAWNGASGTHVMSYRATVLHMEDGKPECVIGQIHDGSDDTLQIRCEGTTWRASINGTEHSTTLGSFAWGTEVAIEIRLQSGTLTIKVNGTTRITTNPGYGSGQYFKLGMYAQQNNTSDGGGNPSNGYASCLVRDLVVSHS
jgi:Alginate lyase